MKLQDRLNRLRGNIGAQGLVLAYTPDNLTFTVFDLSEPDIHEGLRGVITCDMREGAYSGAALIGDGLAIREFTSWFEVVRWGEANGMHVFMEEQR